MFKKPWRYILDMTCIVPKTIVIFSYLVANFRSHLSENWEKANFPQISVIMRTKMWVMFAFELKVLKQL